MFRKLFFAISISLFLAAGTWAQGISSTGSSTDTSKPAAFRPTKDQIKQGQAVLKDKKLYEGEATGVYNDPTRAAIKSYQKDNGLAVNGKFDKVTLEKMNISMSASKVEKSTGASSGSSKKPAPFRANVEQIKAAQKMLRDSKMYSGEDTGKLDDSTREALKKYQSANGLRVMGSLNAATLEKLGISLTDAQKSTVAAQAAYEAAKKN
jgi:peptidoglycan hydrolase-like protein with peptidoglycan-binding domain